MVTAYIATIQETLEVTTTDERTPQKIRREKGPISLGNDRKSAREKINMVSKREKAKFHECPQSIALRLIIEHNLQFGTFTTKLHWVGIDIFHIYCFQI
jgi:hypothetical protein